MSGRFISTYRHVREDGEPYQLYTEIDSRRREIRKVGLFAGGRSERVGVGHPNAEFSLSSEPVIEFVGELSTGKVFLEEISGEWFEELWEEAGTGAVSFIDDDSDVAF
ncbi:hypothetical protein GCM10023107_88820 [Actinoplanes octamycinicus]|uniref:DUF6881 domain-containing protein n=1 Tax=Actinoplanes octamycinicus TaxID=135948 RepID=UPI00337D428A